MHEQKLYLFSYGSMKKGFNNHYRLKNEKFIGQALSMQKYIIYPATSYHYPYALEDISRWEIHGELYELRSIKIEELDYFEGVPDHYYRKEIEVICHDQVYKTFIYFRTATNPVSMETDIPLNNWSREFEVVGEKNDQFLDALKTALLKR